MKQNSNLDHFQQRLCHTFPPPLDQYNLFWPYKKRAPKPLLGCQNWGHSDGRVPKVSSRVTLATSGAVI